MMQKIRWGILILLVIVLLAVVLQNAAPVTLKLFWFETQLPTSTLLMVTSAASFLLGAVITHRMLRRQDQRQAAKTKPVAVPPDESPASELPASGASAKLFSPKSPPSDLGR